MLWCLSLVNITANGHGLAFVVAFENRQARTEADDCNIADVLFISQIYNVLPELKPNSEQKVENIFVKPP